jgi:hypothetical protein
LNDDTVAIPNVTVEKETKAALLVITDNGEKVWVPKSLIGEESEVYAAGDTGNMTVTRWFAEQKEELAVYLE